MKIYTKTGDNGMSSLLYGKRYTKSNAVFWLLGDLDELNAALGFISLSKLTNIKNAIVYIQGDIFILGSVVAGREITRNVNTYFESRLKDIENDIDNYDSKNTTLTNFILPGGCAEAVYLHLARVICRRAERSFIAYASSKEGSKLKKNIILQKYLNRLSDLLFVLARYSNRKQKIKDTVWKGDKIFA